MNFKRTVLYACGLALAVGGPISLFSASDFAVKVRKSVAGWTAKAPRRRSRRPAGLPPEAASADRRLAIPAGPSPLETLPTPTLAEVLRFDVTVEWVMQRWPRVSTGLPYLQLQGYRVPLVSGTSLRDVAGSLTYYFNAPAGRSGSRSAARPATRAPLGGDPGRQASFRPPADERSRRGALRDGRFEQPTAGSLKNPLGQGGEGQPAVLAVRGGPGDGPAEDEWSVDSGL